MNIAEILQFKYPTQLANGQITLQDDGNGIYIKTWNMGSIAKPTDAQIQAYVTDADYISNLAIYNRINSPDGYGTIANQLDMIYKDLRDGTQLWQTKIGNVKDVLYPKTGLTTTPPNVTPIVTTKRNSPSAAFKEIVIAKSSTNQAISSITKAKVVFGTKMSDPNNSMTNSVYTSLTGGLYEVTAFARVTNYALISLVNNYTWEISVTQSGSAPATQVIGTYTHAQLAASQGSLQGTYMVYLAANDTVQIDISKTDATSLNVTFAYVNIKKISEA